MKDNALMVEAIVWIVALVGIVWVFALVVSGGRSAHRPRVGSAATGAIYDMLNEDKRNAIEIIVEGRAEARDPEDKDGNLPELEGSRDRAGREGRGVRPRE